MKRSSQVGYLYHITEELKQGETTQQVDVYLLSFSGKYRFRKQRFYFKNLQFTSVYTLPENDSKISEFVAIFGEE